jgi:hypothetical protein
MGGDIPIVVEWQSTSEFGQVEEVNLVLGVRGGTVGTKYRGNRPVDESSAPTPGVSRTLAVPAASGLYFRSSANSAGGSYWLHPNRSLLFADARTDSRVRCTGSTTRTCRITFQIPVREFPAIRTNDFATFATKRMYVRAEVKTSGDLRGTKRRAYTNPVWIVERNPLILDEIGPLTIQ